MQWQTYPRGYIQARMRYRWSGKRVNKVDVSLHKHRTHLESLLFGHIDGDVCNADTHPWEAYSKEFVVPNLASLDGHRRTWCWQIEGGSDELVKSIENIEYFIHYWSSSTLSSSAVIGWEWEGAPCPPGLVSSAWAPNLSPLTWGRYPTRIKSRESHYRGPHPRSRLDTLECPHSPYHAFFRSPLSTIRPSAPFQ